MKLPLDFRKFFIKNIQKIKNGLRIICCAPHHRRYAAEPPPKGKPRNAALIFRFFRGGKLRDYHRYKYQRAAAKFYGGKRFL